MQPVQQADIYDVYNEINLCVKQLQPSFWQRLRQQSVTFQSKTELVQNLATKISLLMNEYNVFPAMRQSLQNLETNISQCMQDPSTFDPAKIKALWRQVKYDVKVKNEEDSKVKDSVLISEKPSSTPVAAIHVRKPTKMESLTEAMARLKEEQLLVPQERVGELSFIEEEQKSFAGQREGEVSKEIEPGEQMSLAEQLKERIKKLVPINIRNSMIYSKETDSNKLHAEFLWENLHKVLEERKSEYDVHLKVIHSCREAGFINNDKIKLLEKLAENLESILK